MTTTDKVTTTTTSTGTSTTYECPYIKSKAEQGWECPRCGRINAPWVRQCDCSRSNWTITSDWVNKPEWWKEITCNPDTFKVHPESTIYTTTNVNQVVGGSDYWDPISHTYRNTVKDDLNNVKG